MKPPRLLTGFFLLLVPAVAADPSALKFGGERIGVPPLSLSESITSGSTRTLHRPPFLTTLPEDSTSPELPHFSPKLLPRTRPSMPRVTKDPSRSPRVDRDSGMPVIIPNEAVDYAMKVIPPDPNVDFKLVIKDPGKDRRAPASPDSK